MFLAANPEKGKTAEEKEALKAKYTAGDNVLQKVEAREMSLRERRIEDADRRLMDEVRNLSLVEVGVENEAARRERRRREDGRRQRAPSSRDASRDGGRSTGDRERDRERRRRREDETDRRRTETGAESTEERRRRRSRERRSAARQIEHQSSLRSLISSSDVDSREMEEEILRQIREEGLLDGIDLENIDVSQEDQISERIAEAFRRRQSEGTRLEPARRSATSTRSQRPEARSVPDSRETSGDDRPRSSSTRRGLHSRSASAVTAEQTGRPPRSMSAAQAAHLDVQSSDEGRHRRRRTGSSSSRRTTTASVPVVESEVRPAARSQTDLTCRPQLADTRPQSVHLPASRPLVSDASRSSTHPSVQQIAELPVPSQNLPASQTTQNSSPGLRSSPRSENSLPSERRTQAPPSNIIVPASASSVALVDSLDMSLMPAPLSPRDPGTKMSLSDKLNALQSGSRPNSSSSAGSRTRSQLYPEPSLTCARCSTTHIEYDLHYNCGICRNGDYNICLSCYRSALGCLHWFGFGQSAWDKWQIKSQSGEQIERPHMLIASRYLPPRSTPGGAEGRKTLTNEDPLKRLQSGSFCANCLAWANECYWLCGICNEGDWGFCNLCVNQGKSCTHPLLPLTYKPAESNISPMSPTHDQQTPVSASILTGPGVMDLGNFKPLTFSTKCDICRYPIQPSQSRYHCFSCVSRVPGTFPGDYDICTTCYSKLVITSRRISAENGHNGWRRCLQGHRMVVVGFEDVHGGQRRVIVQGLVGGSGLNEQTFPRKDISNPSLAATDLQKWSWGDGTHTKDDDTHFKLVTIDVMKSPPMPGTFPDLPALDANFPPDGGVGMICAAEWSWYPAVGADDELMFPKGAEIRECRNVNDDWFHGTFMGKRGLFPSPYVRVLDRGHGM
ncbi:related to vesicular transport-associated repeat protein Tb-291 [Rhynchosporium secalis]|uniref:Related to vesicular transport-associated repeat protein Tb-291 n=1 Tax=Rhynchosporium secalis TaxID=38038 RepID=A0A1E1MBG5_RHYSE|nr:related to vesicular transport-associated repeat protein Tb-291 [Rhynchosporium secalis]